MGSGGSVPISNRQILRDSTTPCEQGEIQGHAVLGLQTTDGPVDSQVLNEAEKNRRPSCEVNGKAEICDERTH